MWEHPFMVSADVYGSRRCRVPLSENCELGSPARSPREGLPFAERIARRLRRISRPCGRKGKWRLELRSLTLSNFKRTSENLRGPRFTRSAPNVYDSMFALPGPFGYPRSSPQHVPHEGYHRRLGTPLSFSKVLTRPPRSPKSP